MDMLTENDSKELMDHVADIVNKAKNTDQALQEICELLAEIEIFDWVGFYLKDEEQDQMLRLGPYVGEPTDHTRIPYGKGICGQAAESEETFVVQDVSKASNYLSCSVHVESEIVVPVMKKDEFVAELDIDSHTKNAISEQHRKLCENICEEVAELF